MKKKQLNKLGVFKKVMKKHRKDERKEKVIMEEKFKKIVSKILFMSAIFVTSIGVVNAQENIYYTNNNGVEMTEEQYNHLLKYFDEEKISNLTQKSFEWKLNATESTTSSIYVVERTAYDVFGRVIDTTSVEVESEQAAIDLEASLNYITPYVDATATYQTTSKKITLELTKTSYQNQTCIDVALETVWLNNKVPIIKSYDVSAQRYDTDGGVYITPLDGFGTQSYNGNKNVDYSFMGDNTVSAHNGYGTSMNIVDSATKKLQLTLEVLYYYFGTGYLSIYATYQHAIEDITLAQSKDYYFAEGGLGNVLVFSKPINTYYDGMKGVMATITI